MDIEYLLTLQNFRGSISDSLTPVMEWISMAATTYLILIPVFWYWNRDKRQGLYALVSYYFCMFLTPVIKLIACVYRPWIRDPRIVPAGDSIRTATGYSFPSGHTTTCAPLAGGMALNTWKKKYTRFLSVLFVLFILLTAFSRNYLGVHTPQDVAVALIISALSLYATAKLFDYLSENPGREDLFLLGGFLLCWAAIAFISLKSYPTDIVDGKLIVGPEKMKVDGYGDIGKVIGFIVARYIEKAWIRFRPRRDSWLHIILCLIGLVPMLLLKTYFRPVMRGWLGDQWGSLAYNVLFTFYYIALFPLLLKATDRFAPGSAKA
ncbi:MAG: phosphatase PAP2 family protein [Clostridia bacterium]|nr:phosphatase PAP2 family protein [Clostridia bacterium]